MVGSTPDPGVTLTPGDFFVVSRLDGATPLHTVAQMTGKSDGQVAEVLVRLVAAGLAEVDGVSKAEAHAAVVGAMPPPPVATGSSDSFDREPSWKKASDFRRTKTPAETSGMYSMAEERTPARRRRTFTGLSRELVGDQFPVPFEQFTFDPVLMQDATALTDEQKQVVLYVHYHLRRVTYYQLFDVAKDARRSEIKSAYFQLSKAFHPDRWFRKDVGEFADRIEDIFKWLNRAYAVLSSPKKRKGYDRLLQRGHLGEWEFERSADNPNAATSPTRSATPRPRGSSDEARGDGARTVTLLVARARGAASSGDWAKAVDLYGRAVTVAPSAELRIRLAECMLKAHAEPDDIDEQLRAARAAGGDEKEVLLLEAETARRLDDIERAVERYEAVLALEPDNATARLGLSRLAPPEPPA